MTNIPKGRCPDVLKPEHCNTLNQVLQAAADTKELIQACKDCGLPVEEAEAQNAQHLDYASKLKAKFFPLNS